MEEFKSHSGAYDALSISNVCRLNIVPIYCQLSCSIFHWNKLAILSCVNALFGLANKALKLIIASIPMLRYLVSSLFPSNSKLGSMLLAQQASKLYPTHS